MYAGVVGCMKDMLTLEMMVCRSPDICKVFFWSGLIFLDGGNDNWSESKGSGAERRE